MVSLKNRFYESTISLLFERSLSHLCLRLYFLLFFEVLDEVFINFMHFSFLAGRLRLRVWHFDGIVCLFFLQVYVSLYGHESVI